jgi:hypothetical protein
VDDDGDPWLWVKVAGFVALCVLLGVVWPWLIR